MAPVHAYTNRASCGVILRPRRSCGKLLDGSTERGPRALGGVAHNNVPGVHSICSLVLLIWKVVYGAVWGIRTPPHESLCPRSSRSWYSAAHACISCSTVDGFHLNRFSLPLVLPSIAAKQNSPGVFYASFPSLPGRGCRTAWKRTFVGEQLRSSSPTFDLDWQERPAGPPLPPDEHGALASQRPRVGPNITSELHEQLGEQTPRALRLLTQVKSSKRGGVRAAAQKH